MRCLFKKLFVHVYAINFLKNKLQSSLAWCFFCKMFKYGHISRPFTISKMLYPCVVCNEECTDGTIQCSDCEKWVHSTCVPMSAEDFNDWSDANMHFLCSSCCFTDHQFDRTKSLQKVHFFLYLFLAFQYLKDLCLTNLKRIFKH